MKITGSVYYIVIQIQGRFGSPETARRRRTVNQLKRDRIAARPPNPRIRERQSLTRRRGVRGEKPILRPPRSPRLRGSACEKTRDWRRGQGTISEFDSVGCQLLSLNSWARARSGCGALDRVLGKRNWYIQNQKSFPDPVSGLQAGFFLTRSRGERGGRRIGFSPRTPRLRVRLCIPLIHGDRSPSSPVALAAGYWLSRVPAMDCGVSLSCSSKWRFRRNRLTSEVLG